LANLKIIGFVVIAFLAGTITSGAIASADKDKDHHNPITTLAAFCAKLDDKTGFPALVCTAFSSLETQIANISLTPGPQGPPGTSVTITTEPPGPHCVNGGVKLTSASGINYVCNGGSSSSTCSGGAILCGNTCTSTSSDTNNCGACGHACTTGQVCTSGQCSTPSCQPNQVMCAGGTCTDVSSDTHNCGACGAACATNQACVSGACVAGPLQCTTNAQCTSLGGVCHPESCIAGACVVNNSPVGTTCTVSSQSGTCNGSGTCVPTTSQCTSASTCPTPSNACQQSTCTAGTCGVTNAPVGTVCSTQNAVSACNGVGSCAITSCNSGFLDCDQNPSNGCETNIVTDPNNCGSCGTACAKGQVCAAGACH